VTALQDDLRAAGVPLTHIFSYTLDEPQGELA
jgi:hypothetical protein